MSFVDIFKKEFNEHNRETNLHINVAMILMEKESIVRGDPAIVERFTIFGDSTSVITVPIDGVS